MLEKASKTGTELKEVKEDHKEALDKLNVALAFNQKLEAYIGQIDDVVNKARLFDANLAKNPVTAGKVIPVLVDFAEKMEELLDEMRVLFDGLQPDQLDQPSEPTREEEVPAGPELPTSPKTRTASTSQHPRSFS